MAHTFLANPIPSRGNFDLGTLATLTAEGAGTVQLPNQQNAQGCGLVVVVNVTAISGTSPTLTVTLQGYDPGSDVWYTIVAMAAITTTGVKTLMIYPGLTVAAGPPQTANFALPPTWSISYVVGGTTPSVTGTINASVIAS